MLTNFNFDPKRIAHGFFFRTGGVSEGAYSSLNCGFGSGDDQVKVAENRARVAKALGAPGKEVLTCYQTHSAKIALLTSPSPLRGEGWGGGDSPHLGVLKESPLPNPPPQGGRELERNASWAWENSPQADAIVTNRPGIVIGVLTADCAPVLLADKEAGVVAAAHAGWKGALSGIIEGTIGKMEQLGARRERIFAAVGPCIAQASYEVGPEFRDKFLAKNPEHAQFFIASLLRPQTHFAFDLPDFIAQTLGQNNLAQVDFSTHDTCADEARFFSFRRATLRGEDVYGRQISAIMLKE